MTTTHKKEKLYDLTNGVIILNKIELKEFKGYNEITILENINLRVLPSEFVCVLGEKDCGKTKLIKIIGGAISPSSGIAKIQGENIKVIHKDSNIIYNKCDLYGFMTVENNLLNGLKKRQLPKELSKQLVNKYIDKFGLEKIKNKLVWRISKVERIKVEVIKNILNKQRVLLMNNTFQSLNENERKECQIFLKNIWKLTKKTIIFSTDNIEEALLLGTRIVVMKGQPGRIVKEYNIENTESCTTEGFEQLKIDEFFVELKDEIKMTYF